MTHLFRAALISALVTIVAAAAIGCTTEQLGGEMRTESKAIKADGADEVRIWIEFGAGELKVDGAGNDVLNAEMKLASSISTPTMKYEVKRSTGELLIMDRNRRLSPEADGFINDWLLSLTQEMPVELRMSVGAGASRFDVADVDLHKFQLRTGAGDSEIDLAGSWDHNVDVDIDQGAGELTMALPADMPVRVGITEGGGAVDRDGFVSFDRYWVNGAYSGSTDEPTIFVNIEQGLGATNLRLVD